MNPSRLFIDRPVATSLLMAAILLVGLLGLRLLPLSALPEVDYPTIQVKTFFPGASPEVMTSSVTAPLERQLGQMPNLKQMSSSSSAGASVITLQFDLEITLDVAEQEVQAAINAAGALLPGDLPAPPIYVKVNPADAPILTLSVTSATLPLIQVQDMVDTRVVQKLSQLPGVGLVSLSGGQRPAVRVRANARVLAAYGLNIDDVRATINNSNVNLPKGSFDGPTRAYAINANDQLKSADQYRSMIIAYRNGAPVRLTDVADVIDSPENDKLGAWAGGDQALIISVQRQPGANVIEVADGIKAMLPSLQQSLPPAIEVKLLTDRTVTIRSAVHSVQIELALSVGLVVMVIFLFLRNVPATIIPSLSVPLSLIGTFAAMYALDFSLNNLTLMALTIATGFVVDDAIVMIENIARHVENGEDARSATYKGSRQIAFTIISLTVALVAVLIPLLFMGDVVGRLFREFAVTLAVTILISAVVSLTLVPMMCARLLKPQHHDKEPAWSRAWGRWFDALVARYETALTWVLGRQRATLWVALGTLVLTVLLYILIPKGFFPAQDTALIQGISEAPQTASYAAMSDRQRALALAVLRDPDVQSVSSFIGVDGINNTLNTGRMLIALKPVEDRSANMGEVIGRLQEQAASVPGISLYLNPVQDLTIDSAVSRTEYQFTLQDADPQVLAEWVPKLVAHLRKIPSLRDVASNQQNDGLAAYIEVDRDTAARFGITVATIDNALYNAFGQRNASTIFTQSNQYRVILEADPTLHKTIQSLGDIFLPSNQGGQVPLSALATITEQRAPLEINHMAQFPASLVSFNVAPDASLGEAVNDIRKAERDIGLPASTITNFQGSALAFEKALTNQLLLILAAIITVYIVLGVLYESYIHPITILSTLPSAGVGALLALIVTGHDLDIIGIIGIILLIGIVKKNAIMMINFAIDAERNEGKEPREAIYQACLLRFRPILMTTMAAMLGALPLMLGSGTGSEIRQPLGISIVGGLIVSQVLTLFTTPVIYLAFSRLAQRLRSKNPSLEPALPQAAPEAGE